MSEPVAWGVFEPNGRFLCGFYSELAARRESGELRKQDGQGYPVRPLYTHPPTALEAAHE